MALSYDSSTLAACASMPARVTAFWFATASKMASRLAAAPPVRDALITSTLDWNDAQSLVGWPESGASVTGPWPFPSWLGAGAGPERS